MDELACFNAQLENGGTEFWEDNNNGLTVTKSLEPWCEVEGKVHNPLTIEINAKDEQGGGLGIGYSCYHYYYFTTTIVFYLGRVEVCEWNHNKAA